MYRELALDLARDYRVVALMFNESEHEIWREAEGIVCIDLAAEMAREVESHKSDLAARTKEIELETNLPLYKAASNYLLYRRFAKEYYGAWPTFYDTERHMIEEYVGSYGALSRILDEYRPVLIVHEALDLIATLMTLTLAYRRRIFDVGWMFAPGLGDGVMILFYGLRRQNWMCTYLVRNPNLITQESREQARAFIAKSREKGPLMVSHVETRRSALKTPWRAARQMLGGGAWSNPRLLLERLLNWRWLNQNLRHDIPDGPFILFLMHLQPEASTASQAPRWIDQERIIEQIAINAPRGIRIVVKENPQCYGWRGKRYYGALADFANVHLCHPLVSTHQLLRRAEALVTITGSAGLEAILIGTRVAVLGRPFYIDFLGVRQLNNPEQIFKELADPTWRMEPHESDCETFIAAYLQSVHGLGDVPHGLKWPPPGIMGPNFATAVRRALALIQNHDLTPQDFDPGYPLVSSGASEYAHPSSRSAMRE
jgi:hypothetical protein